MKVTDHVDDAIYVVLELPGLVEAVLAAWAKDLIDNPRALVLDAGEEMLRDRVDSAFPDPVLLAHDYLESVIKNA